MVSRHEIDVVVDLGNAQIIARKKSGQRFGHEAAHRLVKPSHDAEIDGDQAAFRIDEKISRMHVGMKEAIAQRLRQEAADHEIGDALGIVTCRDNRGRIAQGRAVDPFAGQHTIGSAAPVDVRHAEIRIAARALFELRCAAASMRRSSSSATETARVSTIAIGRRRLASGMNRSARRAASAKAERSLAEFNRNSRTQHLDRDVHRRLISRHARRGPARSTRLRSVRRKSAEHVIDRTAQRFLDRRRATVPSEMAATGPASCASAMATSSPTTSARVASTCPSLM